MGDWPDADGLIRYKVIPRADITFGGKEYRRRNPGRLTALARSIYELGLLLPPAVVEVGTTRGTEGQVEVGGRPYVLLGGERRLMALGKGSTTPAAVITNWPQFMAWLELDKEIAGQLKDREGVVRPTPYSDRNRFRGRALSVLGDRRPWTRKAREAIAAYYDSTSDEMRSYYALVECVEGRSMPERADLAAPALAEVDAGTISAQGALSRVVRIAQRRAYNGKPAREQAAVIAASLVSLEAAARALDELGDISPEFPQEDLAAYSARLARVRAKITRAARSIRSEGESK